MQRIGYLEEEENVLKELKNSLVTLNSILHKHLYDINHSLGDIKRELIYQNNILVGKYNE